MGHRQNYCNILTNYLLARGFRVVLAVGYLPEKRTTNLQRLSPLIECFRSDARVRIEYLADNEINGSYNELEVISQLQGKYRVDISILDDGDALRPSVSKTSRANKPALNTGSVAIFLHLNSLAPLAGPERGAKQLVRSVLRKAKWLALDYWFFRYKLPSLFPSIQVFVLDPRFTRLMKRANIRWLPDVYAPFDFTVDSSPQQDDIWLGLQEFLSRKKDGETILYFGTNQKRRGYEWLLGLVQEHKELSFLHCGRLDEQGEMSSTALDMRRMLADEGRLYETRKFVTDTRVVESSYRSCQYILLPYQGHYGSSGVMIQAASYGKPVLVPRGGLMAYWVNQYQFGRTFAPGSFQDFKREFHLMRREWSKYVPFTSAFARQFSRDAVYRALDDCLQSFGYI